jgi:outer membrane immunogenic protein
LRLAIAVFALLAATGLAWSADPLQAPVPAADQTLPPTVLPYTWEGFYLRGSGDLASMIQQPAPKVPGGLPAAATGNGSGGGLTSGEFGANWQTGSTVVGFEGDMQWSGQSAASITDCGLGCSLTDKVKVPWLATFRARAGTAFDRVFVYGTGGFATMGTADNLNAGGFGNTPNFIDLSTNNINWTVGGGMEVALDHDVSAKIEYLHLQNSSAAGTPNSLFVGGATDPYKNDIVRGGINYRLPVGQ